MINTASYELMQLLEKHIRTFVEISNEEMMEVMSYFKHKSIRRKQVLLREGDLVRHTYFVAKGLLITKYYDSQGKEYVIQFATENCWITDQDAFYNQKKAGFQIRALEDSELLSLSFADREMLCRNISSLGTFFRKKGNDSFVKQQRRLLTYLTANSEERFNLLTAEYPQLLQRVSKKIIAAYLGVSRETLSRFNK